MAASTPSTFVDPCATEGLSGAGSTDADFNLLNSAVTLPLAASGNSAAHRKARKDHTPMAPRAAWQHRCSDCPAAAYATVGKNIYPMRADQRSSRTWAASLLTIVSTFIADHGDTPT